MSECSVLIHLAPSALRSHVEWTISGVAGKPTKLTWIADQSNSTHFRSFATFACSQESAATLASAFMNLKQLTFEVIFHQAHSGARWSFTPSLGMFSCATDEVGNLVVNENQIRSSMEKAGANPLKLQAELRRLLGQAWDDELEPFRELIGGAEGNHGVVTAEAERVSYSQNIRPL
jgi:hypothetical protein